MRKCVSSRMNVDGKKTVGMFYPSSEAQEDLMVMAYKEAGIDPLKLTYIEAHLTGTKVSYLYLIYMHLIILHCQSRSWANFKFIKK